jgi:hypothetical protein
VNGHMLLCGVCCAGVDICATWDALSSIFVFPFSFDPTSKSSGVLIQP